MFLKLGERLIKVIGRTGRAGALLAFLFALGLVVAPNNARAITTETLTGTVLIGSFSGAVGTGSFTFDETLISGLGAETLTPTDGLEVEFTIFGQTFTHEDDIDFDEFPELRFFDGDIIALDFFVSEIPGGLGGIGGVITDIDEPDVFSIAIVDIFAATAGGFEGEVFINGVGFFGVPEPGALAIFGIGLIGLAGLRRRK